MYIEDVIAERAQSPAIWGEYHPTNRRKSVVMVRGIGCVFVGTVDQCQQYIATHEQKYTKGRNPEVTR